MLAASGKLICVPFGYFLLARATCGYLLCVMLNTMDIRTVSPVTSLPHSRAGPNRGIVALFVQAIALTSRDTCIDGGAVVLENVDSRILPVVQL